MGSGNLSFECTHRVSTLSAPPFTNITETLQIYAYNVYCSLLSKYSVRLCFAHVFHACYRFDFACTHVYEGTHEYVCTHAICSHEPHLGRVSIRHAIMRWNGIGPLKCRNPLNLNAASPLGSVNRCSVTLRRHSITDRYVIGCLRSPTATLSGSELELIPDCLCRFRQIFVCSIRPIRTHHWIPHCAGWTLGEMKPSLKVKRTPASPL